MRQISVHRVHALLSDLDGLSSASGFRLQVSRLTNPLVLAPDYRLILRVPLQELTRT